MWDLFQEITDPLCNILTLIFRTVALVTIFSQYFRFVKIPLCRYQEGKGWSLFFYPVFKLLPVSIQAEQPAPYIYTQ